MGSDSGDSNYFSYFTTIVQSAIEGYCLFVRPRMRATMTKKQPKKEQAKRQAVLDLCDQLTCLGETSAV